MDFIAEHSQLLAAMERGVMPAFYRGAEGRGRRGPSYPGPADPAGIGGSGWQVAGERGDIDADGAQALADLVSDWLPGEAHRRLLELARGTPRDGVDGGFDELAARWLDQESLSRLSALIADAGFESPVYAWRYALGQAFSAVAVALKHTGPGPNCPDAELELGPLDDAVDADPENAPLLSDDVALWLQ